MSGSTFVFHEPRPNRWIRIVSPETTMKRGDPERIPSFACTHRSCFGHTVGAIHEYDVPCTSTYSTFLRSSDFSHCCPSARSQAAQYGQLLELT